MKLSDIGFTLEQLNREMNLFLSGSSHLLQRHEETRYNIFKQINENELIKKDFLCGEMRYEMQEIRGYLFNTTQILDH